MKPEEVLRRRLKGQVGGTGPRQEIIRKIRIKKLVKQIHSLAQLNTYKTKQVVKWTFDFILEALMLNKKIQIDGFGIFELTRKRPRTAHLWHSDEYIVTKPKTKLLFTPLKAVKDKIKTALDLPVE